MFVKLEWLGYRIVKKPMTICSAVFIQYQRVTDRQTADGRTDRIAISILRVSVLTHDENCSLQIRLKRCDDWTCRSTLWIWTTRSAVDQRFVPTAILDSSSGLSSLAPVCLAAVRQKDRTTLQQLLRCETVSDAVFRQKIHITVVLTIVMVKRLLVVIVF